MARKKQKKDQYQTSYYNIKDPLSYAGKTRFIRTLPARRRAEAEKWLSSQPAYLMHRQVPRRFKRVKVIAGFQQQIQADLVDVSRLAKFNSNVRFLLTAIDPFSKKAFVETLLKKDAVSVTDGFRKILDRLGFKPVFFFSDRGKEFLNTTFKAMLKKNHIDIYTSKDSAIKASIIERFQKTLMTKVYKFLTRENSSKYIHVLQDIIRNYNDTPHTATGLPPNKVNHKNKEAVWLRLYRPAAHERKETRFKIGDTVLIPKTRKPFAKGYHGGWAREIFRVGQIRHTTPLTYDLVDLQGDKIIGIFYGPELQKIALPQVFPIESVLDKKKDKLLVKWLNYPKKFNSWISTKDLQ